MRVVQLVTLDVVQLGCGLQAAGAELGAGLGRGDGLSGGGANGDGCADASVGDFTEVEAEVEAGSDRYRDAVAL